MGVGALHCPSCGAAVESAEARNCPYCGAALARVQCGKCFATMFEGSKYCPHCGALGAQRRLMDVDRLACPRCKTAEHAPLMEPAELGGIHLDECAQCGGVWIDQGTFERIMNSAEAQSHALNMLGVMRGATEPKVRYLRCPLCTEMMVRRNYAGRSGVIVDFCINHGLWFDVGELRSVVEFIRSGGLDDAARAAAEQAVSDAERRKSTEFWFGKDGDENRFSLVGPTPLRLLEAALWAMKK